MPFVTNAPSASWSRYFAGRMTLPFVSRECWNSPRNIRNPSPLGPRPPPRGHFQGGDLPLTPLGHHFTPFRGTLHPSPPLFNPHRSLFLPQVPLATRMTSDRRPLRTPRAAAETPAGTGHHGDTTDEGATTWRTRAHGAAGLRAARTRQLEPRPGALPAAGHALLDRDAPGAVQAGHQQLRRATTALLIDGLQYRVHQRLRLQPVRPAPDEEIPQRFARAAEVLAGKLWREQLQRVGRGAQAGGDRASTARSRPSTPTRSPTTTSSTYLTRCRDHHAAMIGQHMRFTAAAIDPDRRLPRARRRLDRAPARPSCSALMRGAAPGARRARPTSTSG